MLAGRGDAGPTPGRRRGVVTWTRRRLREPVILVALVALTLVVGVIAGVWPSGVPLVVLIVPLVLGGLVLTGVRLVWLVSAVLFTLAINMLVLGAQLSHLVTAVVFVIIAWVLLAQARWRTRLGVPGMAGDSMLVDLRDRLAVQGEVPPLPRGWEIEVVTRPAEGSAFAGDFVVSAATSEPDTLELVLVDVSGKGLNAGTRALLLSGAFGGLLGSLPPSEFLVAANAYLQRQRWAEGFATAIHVVVELDTGFYEVRTAGHPPLIHYSAGSGRWTVAQTEGIALGLNDVVDYQPAVGELSRGDALLVYSDGVVESTERGLSDGIDWLQGQAERLVVGGFRNGARTLVDAVESSNDDRALVMLWRT